MLRLVKIAAAVILWGCILSVCFYAADKDAFSDAISSLEEIVPDEARQYLPKEIFENSDASSLDVGWFYNLAVSFFNGVLKAVVGDLMPIFGILVLASAVSVMAKGAGGDEVQSVFSYISTAAVALCLWQSVSTAFEGCRTLVNTTAAFADAMLPVMGSLYIAGGNVTTAALSNAGISAVFTLLENFCAACLFPLLRVCFALALVSVLSHGFDMSPIISFVKNTLSWLVLILTTALSCVLAFQNNLAQSADSLVSRGVKFAVGSFVPIVGGAVAEAMRTVAGSLNFVKGTVGVIAVAAIAVIVLPTLIRIGITRLILSACSSVAKLLGCAREGAFIGDIKGLFDFALAISACSSLFCIFCFTMLIRTASAIGV